MREGGGTNRPSEKPARTASSQRIARATGRTSPSAGRANRANAVLGRFCSTEAGSIATLIWTRVIKPLAKGKVPHTKTLIPGHPPQADEPGIHIHRPGLWIPGSRPFGRAPE